MSDGDDDRLRDELQRRLLGLRAKFSTSSLGRFGRTALAALRGGHLAWRSKAGKEDADVDTLATIVSSVGQLKGIAMKAGQLMSYLDVGVPPEIQSALAVLPSHSPPLPFLRVVED